MADGQSRAVSLRSNQWSCSELTKGAEMCANLAGLDLAVDPNKMTRSELIQAIKEAKDLLKNPGQAPSSSGLLKPKEEIVSDAAPVHEADTLPADESELAKAACAWKEQKASELSAKTQAAPPQRQEDRKPKRVEPDTRETVSPEKKVPKGVEEHNSPDDRSKRPAPPREEKISPVTKSAKGDSSSDDGKIVRRALFSESQDDTESDSTKAPSPAKEPKTKGTHDAELLKLALEKIAQLEAVVKGSKASPVETPPTKVRMSTPTSTCTTTTPKEPQSCESKSKDDGGDSGDGGKADDKNGEMIVFPNGSKFISHDALRMRLRCLCETKAKSGRCNVDDETAKQYAKGGESREWLEIALVEALQKVGPDCRKHKALRAEFQSRVVLVRERMTSKEQEVLGQWMTEEKMEKSGDFSKETISSIIRYCERFPAALVRAWKYDSAVREFFVETCTKQTIRQTELQKQQELVDCSDRPVEPIHVGEMQEITEEGHTPQAERLGDKVLPDLIQFMDKVHNKMMSVHTNVAKLEMEADGLANPATKELMKDWVLVGVNLKTVFQSLAELKADMTINEDDTSEKLRERFSQLKEKAKKPSADILTLESRQKLLIATVKKAAAKPAPKRPKNKDQDAAPEEEKKPSPKGDKGDKGEKPKKKNKN